MKKLIVLVVVLVAVLLGYNYVTTGTITLVPGGNLSEVEQRLAELEDEFDRVRKQAGQAYRTASLSGIDTTSEVEAARRSLGRIQRSLQGVQQRLDSDSAKRKARRLAAAIREFEQQFR